MQDQGYLTANEADLVRARPPALSAAAEQRSGGFFADWVMSSGPSFLTRETTEDVIIHTTYDQRIQRAAEDALTQVFSEKVSDESAAQAAIVVMSADGAVRAMVGGRDEPLPGDFNRATQASRQTGSAFKPFVYAAALDLGWTYESLIEDAPFCMKIPGSGQWCPENYTRDYKGWVTLTDALRNSLNIPAVKLSEAVGPRERAHRRRDVRHRKRPRGRAGAGARGLRDLAVADDRGLRRHPQRRLVGHALRAGRSAACSATRRR